MLTKIKIISQVIVFLFIFQQSAFAHFIDSEVVQKSPLEVKAKTQTKPTVKPDEKIIDNLGYINFIKDESYYDIIDKAERENKAIFIDFYANWCGPCNIMDREVFNDSSVANYMNKNFINYKVNVNTRTGSNLAYRYNVELLPTFLIITPKGEIITKRTGLLDSQEFVEFAKNAVIY